MREPQRAVHAERRRSGAYYQAIISRMAAVTLFTLLLAGCGRSPQTVFYALTPVVPVSESAKLSGTAPSITIAAVTLPELVDRPQLVVADTDSKVAILETRRWAEPLKSAVPRLLAENLSRLTGAEQVSWYPQHAANNADYKIVVDIQRFEASDTAVTVDALWSIRNGKRDKPSAGRSKITEPIASAGHENMVAACNRALAGLSRDLAKAIHTMQTKE